MNLYWFLLITGWLVTVAIVRFAISAAAALALSTVFGLTAQAILFVPPMTFSSLKHVLALLFMSVGGELLGRLAAAASFGVIAWLAVEGACRVVERVDKLMGTKTN